MTERRVQCRAYIVYRNGLFAEGMRSILGEARNAVEVIGVEDDVGRALKAVASLKPDVVIVEEPTSGKDEMGRLEAFLESSAAGRVVYLSLDHDHATVYQREQVTTVGPADLVKAIRGGRRRKPYVREPDQRLLTAARVVRPESRVRRSRRERSTKR